MAFEMPSESSGVWWDKLSLTVSEVTLNQWLDWASSFRDYNYTHYWEYARAAAERIGAVSQHIAVRDAGGDVVALCNVRIKRLPFGLGGIAYISGGPMVEHWDNAGLACLGDVLEALKQKYAHGLGLVLRISQRHKPNEARDFEESIYCQSGFEEYGQTNSTILIDLRPELETIRKQFHSKWRNHLNKSERQEVNIKSGTELFLFEDFSGLFNELVSEKGFDVDLDDRFFAKIQKKSPAQEMFHIAIAYHQEIPIAGHLSSIGGDASVYLLGASNKIGRRLRAAYQLQWHMICESRGSGCQWYDLGGIDPEKNPHVYQFKKRMGGEQTPIGKVFQYSKGMKVRLVLTAESVYRKFKK